MPLPSALPLRMTSGERAALERMARSSSRAHRQVVIARALVFAADGLPTNVIGRELGVRSETVRAWRLRFAEEGVAGVGRIAPGRGRKPSLPADLAERIVEATCTSRPPGGDTHWSTRGLAATLGVSHETVRRVWQASGLTAWRIDTFKVSSDPRFAEKLVDVVGMYLQPPARVVVFAFDHECSAYTRAATRTRAGTRPDGLSERMSTGDSPREATARRERIAIRKLPTVIG